MGRKEEYTYRSGEPERWGDYREEARIVGYSWVIKQEAERQRRRAKLLRRVRRLLWFTVIAAALWLLKR